VSTLGRLLAARAKRRFDPLTLEEFGALLANNAGYGPTAAGVSMSDRRALGITAWYSGIRYLCESVAYLPLDGFRRVAGNERESSAGPVWLIKPDEGWIRQSLFEGWMLSLLNRGYAAGFKLRDGLGRVVGMRYLHPDRIKPLADEKTGLRVFEVKMTEGIWQRFTERDIFWVPFLSLDGINPVSPIAASRLSLGTVAAADELAATFFGNASHIRDYVQLTQPVRGDDVGKKTQLKAELDEFHKGLKKAHSTPVLSHGAEYKTVTLKADDAQLLESRQFGVTEVARILRIPPHKLYELTRSTNNNIEHQSIESVTDSVRPWCLRFEAWMNATTDLVPAGTFLEFNLEGLLRGDIKTRYESYHHAIQDGWMTLAEPRRRENYPPLDGMDVAYRPANMHVVDPDSGTVKIPAGKAAADKPTDRLRIPEPRR
jgi:HK97 family phage portal protein